MIQGTLFLFLLRLLFFPYHMLMKGDLIWLTVVSVSSCIGSDATFG